MSDLDLRQHLAARPVPADGAARAAAEGRRRQTRLLASAGSATLAVGLAAVLTSSASVRSTDSLGPAAPPATAPSPTLAASSAPPPAPVETAAEPAPPPTTTPPVPAAQPTRSEQPPPAAGTTPPAVQEPGAALYGRRFTAVERTRDGQPWPFVDGTSLTVEVGARDERLLRWNAGCNTAAAELEIRPTHLVTGMAGSSAAMCDDARMRQEADVNAFFDRDPAWEHSDGVLTLTVDDVVVRLQETR